MSDTDDVIDGNVGTEYDEIDQSTMYFDGVPPTWTFEKLEELRAKGELDGNIDVASDGIILNKVQYDDEIECFKHYEFSRQIEILPKVFYEVENVYSDRNVFELRRVCTTNHDDIHMMFTTESTIDEVREAVKKLLDSGVVKRKEKESAADES